jgi:hypothetical protein
LCQRQPIIDRIADQLPSWKADLLTKPGRNFLVQFVLTGMMIYSNGARIPGLGIQSHQQAPPQFLLERP